MRNKAVEFSIQDIVDIVKQRRERKSDAIIAVTGKRDKGKSTLSYKICKRLKNFKPEKDIVYNLEELRKRLQGYERQIIVDEAIYTSYKRNWQQKGQIDLIQMLNAYRDHRNVVIFCVPNFWDLDKPIRDLCLLRIEIIIRREKWAKGKIHRQLQSSFTSDFWDVYNNQKIERKEIVGKSSPKHVKLTTFVGYIKFKPLTQIEEERYQKIKDRKRNEFHASKVEELYQGSIYEKVLQLYKDNKLSLDMVKSYCLMNGKKLSVFRSSMNRYLEDVGESIRFSKMFPPERNSKKKVRFKSSSNHQDPIKALISLK